VLKRKSASPVLNVLRYKFVTLDHSIFRVTYTRYHIDTIESPDDEHLNTRNM